MGQLMSQTYPEEQEEEEQRERCSCLVDLVLGAVAVASGDLPLALEVLGLSRSDYTRGLKGVL